MHEQALVLREGQSTAFLHSLLSSGVCRLVINIPASVVEIEHRGINYGVVVSSVAIMVEIENDGDYEKIMVSSSYYCVGE